MAAIAGVGAVWDAVSIDGLSDPFTLPPGGEVFLGLIIETMTAASFQAFLDFQVDDSTWQNVITLAAQTAPGSVWGAVQEAAVNLTVTLLPTARIRWTCTGGDATFAATAIAR